MSKPRSASIDRGAVLHIAGQVLAAHLATVSDPATIDDSGMATLADVSVRAALAIDDAIERAEERLAAEAAAAEKADADQASLDRAAAADARAADKVAKNA